MVQFDVDKYVTAAAKKSTNNIHVPQTASMFTPDPNGMYVGRLIGYVEEGIHESTYNNQTIRRNTLRLDFELSSLDKDELESMRDGENRLPLKSKVITLSFNEKSNLFKLSKSMDPDEKYEHLYQMLNKIFLLELEFNTDKETKRISYFIKNVKLPIGKNVAPNGKVEIVDYSNYAAPISRPIRCFIWDHPSIEAWDSLYIPGEYNKESKNYIQNHIRDAVNFKDSPIYELLTEAERDPFTDYDDEGNIIYQHVTKK